MGPSGTESRLLSPVRRVEKVVGPPKGRVVALVFEDGPTAAPPRPEPREPRWRGNRGTAKPGTGGGGGITDFILDVLGVYSAKATFAIIGSTAANYPDVQGPVGSPQWNGVAYDHFPEFGRDALAGAVANPDLVRRILSEGHELANHSWRHIVFGPEAGTYGPPRKKGHHAGFAAALGDFRELHDHIRENFGYEMRLGRPPHYVDAIRPTPAGGPGERDAYDVLAELNYNYLGRGIDGGGWGTSSGSYDADVDKMVLGLQRMLEKDGRALCGAVVSQKDGYDFAGRSPVVAALPREMQLFRNYGYRVVTVSALLEMSPFADIGPGHPVFEAARKLAREGWWVAFRDNTVRPEAPVTRGELAVWAAGAAVGAGAGATGTGAAAAGAAGPPGDAVGGLAPRTVYVDVPAGHPYRWAVETAARRGLWRGLKTTSGRPNDPEARGNRVFGLWDPVSPAEFAEVMGRTGIAVDFSLASESGPPASAVGSAAVPRSRRPDEPVLTHGQALVMLAAALGGSLAAGESAASAASESSAAGRESAAGRDSAAGRERPGSRAGGEGKKSAKKGKKSQGS